MKKKTRKNIDVEIAKARMMVEFHSFGFLTDYVLATIRLNRLLNIKNYYDAKQIS